MQVRRRVTFLGNTQRGILAASATFTDWIPPVAFPRPFLRHTLLWNLPGGEKAACSIAWDNDGGGVISIGSDMADAFAARGTALWTSLHPSYASTINYVGSRLALIGVDGKSSQTVEMASTADPGTADGETLPPEVATVVSFSTGLGTRQGRGRIYLPCMSSTQLQSGGRVHLTSRDRAATSVAAYCAPLTNSATTFFPVVASKTGSHLSRVTSVRCGDVYDSQRRRRASLVEAYKVVNL